MRLNPKALAIALGLICGAGIFLVGIGHLLWPGYGSGFLAFFSAIYPGYRVDGFGDLIVGTLYGLVDGAVSGLVIAWIYNRVAKTAAP